MTTIVILERLTLITVIAGAVGFERERHGRAAGFRTHILVGIGSCLVMLTGIYLAEVYPGKVEIDRMAAQVISGIGFLGAGTILRFRASVRGLTTAASLWAVGGIGLAAGAGFLQGAVWTGIFVFIVMFAFSGLERAMRKEWYQTLVVETRGGGEEIARIRKVLADYEIEIRDLDVQPGKQAAHTRLELQVKLLTDQPRENILNQLRRLEHTVDAYWA